MAHLPLLQDFADELGQQEVVLRGGCLKHPVLLTKLEEVAARKYFKLNRNSNTLRMFFTGNVSNSGAVTQRRLVDLVKSLRDDAMQACGAVPDDAVAEEPVDSLGTDEADSSSATPAGGNRRESRLLQKSMLAQFPVVTVKFPLGEETMEMRVKAVRSKAEAPSCEATAANFRALFCWYRQAAESEHETSPEGKPFAAHAPEDHPDGRQYFRKDRACFYVKRPKPDDSESSRDKYTATFVTEKRKVGRPSTRARAASFSQRCEADKSGSASDCDNDVGAIPRF